MKQSLDTRTAANYLRSELDNLPDLAVILGSGLSHMLNNTEILKEIKYADIPGYPLPTVEGHSGKWLLASVDQKLVAFLSGRFHYYEGYNWQELVFPIGVLDELGISNVVITNACGSTNPDYNIGDIVLISDHINLLPLDVPISDNQRIFMPDSIYPKTRIKILSDRLSASNISLRTGVYCVLQGPTLETRAEYTWLYRIGADVVGMSSVPEALEAHRRSIEPLMVAVVTDKGYPPDDVEYTTHEDVLRVAKNASGNVWKIIREYLSLIREET